MDNNKPIAPLIGANGNIFNLLSIARNSLIANNKPNDALEMWNRVTNSKSYNDALRIIEDYVEFGESDGHDVSDHTWTYELEEQRQKKTVGTVETGTEGIEDRTIGKVGSIRTAEKEHCRQVEFNGSIDNNNEVTKVNFTQELHITKDNIDGIMESALEEGVLNWYESISSSPTIQEDLKSNLISSGGTIFIKLQGEDYSRTFDKQDLIYGLLRKLPDCLYVINGTQIDTTSLSDEDIDHIIQYGIFGEIKFEHEE